MAARRRSTHAFDEMDEVLAEAESAFVTDAYKESKQTLEDFASKLEEFVNRGSPVRAEVGLEVGHLVDFGQEHRVVVRAPAIGLKDYLLRAYINFEGEVTIDTLVDDHVQFRNAADLVRGLIDMMKKPDMNRRLVLIRQLLQDESVRGPRPVVPRSKRSASR